MTSVKYEYQAHVRAESEWLPLPVTSIIPSIDLDRMPFTAASMTLAEISDELWTLLDPRTVDPKVGGQVKWRIRQLDIDGKILGYVPRWGSEVGQWAVMHTRTAARTLAAVELILHGGESLVDDRIVIEETGAYGSKREITHNLQKSHTLGEYVDRVLGLTFGSGGADPADDLARAAAVIPAWESYGNPRGLDLENPAPAGASFMQLVETNLSAVGCRLIDAWGLGWFITDRDQPPRFDGAPALVRWASHDDNLPAGVEPIITGFSEQVSRDGGWADTVSVTGQSFGADEGKVWQHFAEGGWKSRGLIVQMQSAEPSANLAQGIASRAFRRGHDITITARIVLDVLPGAAVEVHLKSRVLTAEVVSVLWDLDAGEMTVQARSAQSLTVDSTGRVAASRITADRSAALARELATEARDDAIAAARAFAGRVEGDIIDNARWRSGR